jgi:hypothetical protein
VNNELKGCERKRPLLNLRHSLGVCLEDLSKTAKTSVSRTGQGGDLNPLPPNTKLTTRPRCSVSQILFILHSLVVLITHKRGRSGLSKCSFHFREDPKFRRS